LPSIFGATGPTEMRAIAARSAALATTPLPPHPTQGSPPHALLFDSLPRVKGTTPPPASSRKLELCINLALPHNGKTSTRTRFHGRRAPPPTLSPHRPGAPGARWGKWSWRLRAKPRNVADRLAVVAIAALEPRGRARVRHSTRAALEGRVCSASDASRVGRPGSRRVPTGVLGDSRCTCCARARSGGVDGGEYAPGVRGGRLFVFFSIFGRAEAASPRGLRPRGPLRTYAARTAGHRASFRQ